MLLTSYMLIVIKIMLLADRAIGIFLIGFREKLFYDIVVQFDCFFIELLESGY